MRTKFMEITPSLAEKWLKNNTLNRDLKEIAITQMVRDLKAGAWHPNHQGFALGAEDDNGRRPLYDGQNRATACVRSGVSFWSNVTFDVPHEARDGMDLHTRRTVNDCLKISHGREVKSKHPAIARAMYMQTVQRKPKLSRAAEVEFFLRNEKLIKAADLLMARATGDREPLRRAPIVAAIACAAKKIDRPTLEHFTSVLISGSATNPWDHTVVWLREKILANYRRGGDNRCELYSMTEQAIVAFVKKAHLRTIRPADEPVFAAL